MLVSNFCSLWNKPLFILPGTQKLDGRLELTLALNEHWFAEGSGAYILAYIDMSWTRPAFIPELVQENEGYAGLIGTGNEYASRHLTLGLNPYTSGELLRQKLVAWLREEIFGVAWGYGPGFLSNFLKLDSVSKLRWHNHNRKISTVVLLGFWPRPHTRVDYWLLHPTEQCRVFPAYGL